MTAVRTYPEETGARTSPLRDLVELARPFPAGFIERKDGKDYVPHHVVTQRLLSVVGPFDFELVEILRGDVPAIPPDPHGRSPRARAGAPALRNVVVGGVWRLTCEIDGRRVRIEEIGDVGEPHNWPHDGARLKDAASDALKRCAMRLGLGLHLWAQEQYFLDRQLAALLHRQGGTAEAEEAAARARRAEAAAAEAAREAATPAAEAVPAGQAEQPAGEEPQAGAAQPAGGAGPAPEPAAPAEPATAARRMPVWGSPQWQAPSEELVSRFEELVAQAGVSLEDARELLRSNPYYSGVSDPRDMHAPTLARLVERMAEEGGAGLAAFRAKVEELTAKRAKPEPEKPSKPATGGRRRAARRQPEQDAETGA